MILGLSFFHTATLGKMSTKLFFYAIHVIIITDIFPTVFKMAAVFLNCTGSVGLCILGSSVSAICRILVLTKNRQWEMQFPTTFVFKAFLVSLTVLSQSRRQLARMHFTGLVFAKAQAKTSI